MRGRWQLAVACAAVLLSAADTYVVVLALPEIMRDVGLSTAELQRAAPIVTVFLLGYVAGLPLLGRFSDRYGRLPVLVGCVAVFALGSAVTAAAPDLAVVVAGRGLQGLGGGGLVPVTLALVADLFPADRRGVPLGVVGAVQELGAVLGPLYGAVIVAASGWRLVFWINLAVGLGCVLALRRQEGRHHRDLPGAALLAGTVAAGLLALASPAALTDHVTAGEAFVPVAGVASPLVLLAVAGGSVLAVRELRTPHPLLPLRGLPRLVTSADVPGGLLLAGVLGCVVVTFAAADPERQVVADAAPWALTAGAVLTVAFVARERRAAEPLIPPPVVRAGPAVGALLVSLAVGVALIAALVDVPLFARATSYPGDQVGASLVLVRFLVALPVGAFAGGLAVRRLGPAATAAAGLALATTGFTHMATWDADALDGAAATVALVAAGFGFGLAIAPVNVSILGAAPASAHGIASALVVVARSVGMLVGLSLLTAIGLRRFTSAVQDLTPPDLACPTSPADCPSYEAGVTAAVLDQLHAIFAGAAVATATGAALALILLRAPQESATTGRSLG